MRLAWLLPVPVLLIGACIIVIEDDDDRPDRPPPPVADAGPWVPPDGRGGGAVDAGVQILPIELDCAPAETLAPRSLVIGSDEARFEKVEAYYAAAHATDRLEIHKSGK